MKIRLLLSGLFLLVTFTTFSKRPKIKTGYWYASIRLNEMDHLPVLMEYAIHDDQPQLAIINGSERILLENIRFEGDSIFVDFPAFASELRAEIHNKKYISGCWYNHAKKGNYYLPFWSRYEKAPKYPIEEPLIDVTGKWEVYFGYNNDFPDPAIGVFESNPTEGFDGKMIANRVTGTFLTETGDFRFLEGAVIKDSLYLSTFDGSHAFLFKAQLKSDTLWGEFLSGKHYKTNWFALRNENFELGDPDSLTYLKNDTPISFSLPDLNGSTYTYPHPSTDNKVTLIQIMGTWCPNCLDETLYLKQLHKKHQGNLAIIAVTFETQKELADKIEKVADYKENLQVPYTFLIGGEACKPCATKLFPMLNDVLSFPTLIFIDKKGQIRKIHTGFSGPGTGDYYTSFVEETNSFVDGLMKE